MPTPLLAVTEVAVDPGRVTEAIAAWPKPLPDAALYRGTEESTLLELTPLADLTALDALTGGWDERVTALAPLLTGDVRRQVLRFVAAPRPTEGPLPDSRYVQLRHVEIKPPVLEEYLAWREGTIFDVVRGSDRIEGFLAYHSLLSTEPGVMFVSGFSCEPEEYLPAFASERYGEIARYAHSRFVTEDGLYTRIYERVPRGGAR
jgi:hypothetical protein